MWGSNRRGTAFPVIGHVRYRLARLTRTIDGLITPDRLRMYPRIFLAGSVVGVVLSSIVRIVAPSIQGAFLPDYLAHWTGGGLLLSTDSASLYDPETQSAFQKSAIGTEVALSWFVSPPIVATFYAPLALLPYNLSGVIWLIVSTALLVWCVLSLKSLGPVLMARKRLVVVLAVLASPVVFELLGGGQDSAFILAVWLIGIRLLGRGHSFWAGAVLGMGFAKPQLVVLVPLVLLVTHNYRALAGFVAVCASLLGISIGLVGLEGLYRWVEALSSPLYLEQVQHGQAWKMVGLPSLLQGLLPQAAGEWMAPILATLALPIGAGILLLRLYKVRKLEVATQAIWISTLATTAVFSPHLATYDALLFVPVIVYLMEHRPSPVLRVSTVAAVGLLWILPLLYMASVQLPWPLSIIDASWSAIPLALIWFESLKALKAKRKEILQVSEDTLNSTDTGGGGGTRIEGHPEDDPWQAGR